MATEAGVFGASFMRPRPLILMLLGGVLAVIVLLKLGGSAQPQQPVSGPPSAAQQKPDDGQAVDSAALDVKLEALASERPDPADSERNPFRFKPKPPPAPPPLTKPTVPEDIGPVGPPPPPPPPPITVKFIGTLDLPEAGLVAIFTDCTVGRKSVPVREGGTILGQYRLVKIGLQSVVVEHLDGRGRTTLPKTGQECVK